MSIFLPFYLFLIALLVAYMEVQIEGKNGWAAKLPTWRFPHRGVIEKIRNMIRYRHSHRGKDIDGYHISIFTILILFFFLPFLFSYPLTLPDILLQWSIFFLFVLVWDFLWFVINPFYSLSSFNKDKVWWHTGWIWKVPVLYILSFALSALLVVPFAIYTHDHMMLFMWLWQVCILSLCTSITIFIASFVKEEIVS